MRAAFSSHPLLALFCFSCSTFVPTLLAAASSRSNRPSSPELPQCTDNFVLSSELQLERPLGDETTPKRLNITAHLQLATVALGETFCMLVTANRSLDAAEEIAEDKFGIDHEAGQLSMLHTIEYVRLELHYGITGAYRFAIPALTPHCKCDCAGGEIICSIEKYQYKNCSAGALCYRTHRDGQVNTGCLTTGKAEICCQVEVNPYRDWTFQAIRLKQPSILLILRYRIFERAQASGTQWANSVDQTVAIPLNKGTTKLELSNGGDDSGRDGNSRHRVEISAAGSRPHRQMEAGMYFYQVMTGSDGQPASSGAAAELRYGVALNGPGESSLEKLGWLRWGEKGQGWTIRKGLEKITQAQHISVQDCKAQRYRATFNAEQFVLRGFGGPNGERRMEEELANFDLGMPLREEPWVEAVKVGEREVVLEHAEGTALALTIRTESRPRIVLHSSQLSNFTGAIVLDKESNRYLNLTFYNARGTLIGQIFSSADSLSVMESIFSIDVGKFTMETFQRVVATSAQSPKLVCFYPIGDLEGRMCQRLEFVREPLQEQHFADQWQQGQTECSGCNERGVDSFLASLDPRQWLDGLNTPAEFFTCVLELVLCLAFLLLSILVFTKCVIPLCRCVRFVAKPAKKH